MSQHSRKQWHEAPGLEATPCDACKSDARWSIQDWEHVSYRTDPEPITRWFACGRHLHQVLDRANWSLDAIQLMDLGRPPAGAK